MLTNIATKVHVKYLIIILSEVCDSIISVYIWNALNYNFIITDLQIKAAYILVWHKCLSGQ